AMQESKQKKQAAETVKNAKRQQRCNDPRIKRPNRLFAVSFTMRERTSRRDEYSHKCEGYRSHPLNTIDASPCIERAKVKIKAVKALVDPTKAKVGNAPDMFARAADRHDIKAARHDAAAPKN